MQTNNPFDLILSRLEQLQSSVNVLSENSLKITPARQADSDRLLDLSEAAEVMRKVLYESAVPTWLLFFNWMI